MDPGFFSVIGLIIMIGFLGNLLFKRTKIPESLFLIVIGLLIGPVFNIIGEIARQSLFEMSSFFATLALIVILLDSGIGMDIRKILRTFSHAALFTLAVFFLSMVLVASFLHFGLLWPLTHALILGAIAGGTTTITVMALISHCNISQDTKNLLFLESMINDVTLILGVVILIQIIQVGHLDAPQIAYLVLGSISIGLLLGFLAGILWVAILNKQLEKHPLNYISTLAVAFILYGLVESVKGNGAIAVLLFSLTVGNFRNIIMRLKIKTDLLTENSLETLKKIKTIQLGITFFVKTFFFVFLGIIFSFNNLTQDLLVIVVGMIVLLLIARFISTTILSAVDRQYRRDSFLITFMLPRGFTATVVAFLPLEANINIPALPEIVLLMLFSSTVVAIIGTMIFEKIRPAEIKEAEK